MTRPQPRFEAEPNVGNHFAWIRTELGLQRTLLAATRTSIALIGFGFTVAQFFQRLVASSPGTGRLGPDAPRNLGLILIGAGLVSLAIFTWQYWNANRYMSSAFAQIAISGRSMHTATYVVSFVVMAIGLAALLSVFFRF